MYLKILQKLLGQELVLEEAPITISQATLGWHSTVLDQKQNAISSGCAQEKDLARRIAVAEGIERAMFQRLFHSEQVQEFYLQDFPSTSGFAAGFEQEATAFRSLCEAVERWAWSQWIDRHCSMDEVMQPQLSPLAEYFLQFFDRVHFFQKKFFIVDTAQGKHELIISIVIAEKSDGIFPGSRVTSGQDDCWTHACIEAWRHLKIYDNLKKKYADHNHANLQLIEKRIFYFAEHKESARDQIKKAQASSKTTWPRPELLMMKQLIIPDTSFYLWRALCKDYMPWHLGDADRFVY